MGIIKKPDIYTYWSTDPLMDTPFFRKYMSRDRFLIIMSMLHFNNDEHYRNVESRKPKNEQDRLYKLRPLIDVLDRTFLLYTPEKELALDEGGCPYKGRLGMRVYCSSKPNKFSIKTYQLCEATTGYTISFEVHTGKIKVSWDQANDDDDDEDEDDEDPNQNPKNQDLKATTGLVLRLMSRANCLGKGHHVYMDSYYNSPELAETLSRKKTLLAGTLQPNREGVPTIIGAAKKFWGKSKKYKGQCLWRRKGDTLILAWMDKRCVCAISTIHAARMKNVKYNFQNTLVQKPETVIEYNKYMYGVDLSDQLVAGISPLRKSLKWWRKLAIHLINVAATNAFVICKKFGDKPNLSHTDFILEAVRGLVAEAQPHLKVWPLVRTPSKTPDDDRLKGLHFPAYNEKTKPDGRENPPRPCKLCMVRGIFPRKNSSYCCGTCKVVLCIKCFQPYHTLKEITQESVKDFFDNM